MPITLYSKTTIKLTNVSIINGKPVKDIKPKDTKAKYIKITTKERAIKVLR